VEPKKPAVRSESGSEKKSGPWRPTKRQVLWIIGMMVALLTTALLIVSLRPEIWKGLLEKWNLTLIAIGVGVTAIIVLLAIGGASLGWTGFRGKTVWDFLQLLIVPLMLAAIGFWFTAQQDQRQQQIEDKRAQQAQKIEDQRAEAERELAAQRAQDEALQAYLDQMSGLLLERELRTSKEDSEVRTLARARTLTVLKRLDSERNSDLLQFLHEAQLISGTDPVITLNRSNLSGAQLSGLDLRDYRIADLSESNLSGANLCRANLSGAFLRNANLKETFWRNADLSDADLSGIKGRTSEQLERQAETLKGATMPNGQKYEDWLKDKKAKGKNEKNE
jgi:uncharacterized protein YjbI with pentapeptide repeats